MNGARFNWLTILVDGQPSDDEDWVGLSDAVTSVDSISEMTVTMSNYTAEFGRNLGPTISMVTKTGTKDFHGGLYAYVRNEALNANEFFNNRNGLPKALYRYNSFGGMVGGPIYIPNHFNANKEKLFFFYSQEEWRQENPISPYTVTVPTAAERLGDFSQTLDLAGNLIPIIDPLTHHQFQGNIIPPNRINSNGQALLNMIPLPNQLNRNVTAGAFNYEWQDLCVTPKRMQALKPDYKPTSKDTITLGLRRWWSDDRAYTCYVSGYDDLPLLKHHYLFTTDTALPSWTHVFSPTVVNEFNIGVVGQKQRGNVPGPFPSRAKDYFVTVQRPTWGYTLGQWYPQVNVNNTMPQATYGGVPDGADTNHSGYMPGDYGYTRFDFSDHLSWNRGPHTFKFGLDYEEDWAQDGPQSNCGDGCFSFARDPQNPGDANWPYATALLGNFDSYQETNNRPRYLYARREGEWFAQDTWKATRKLALTMGVRLSAFSNWDLAIGQGSAFIPGLYDPTKESPLYTPALDASGNRVAQDPLTGQLFPGPYIGGFVSGVGNNFEGTQTISAKSGPRTFQNPQPVQVAPRFGFAYDPIGNGKTAIRGGFGVTKLNEPSYGRATGGHYVLNPPSQLNPETFYGSMDTLVQSGGSAGVLFPGSTGAFQKNFATPSMYSYSFSIQREIGFNTVVDISYVGNKAQHLIQVVNLNTVPYSAHFLPQNQDSTTGASLPNTFLRPIPGYQSINYTEYAGISNYNSLQASANRRFTRGVQFGLSYTWAKNLASESQDGANLAYYVPWRIWDYGPTWFDQRQVFSANYVWDLPKASQHLSSSGAQFVARQILDGWTVSGITKFANGFPRTVSFITTDGADISGGGDGVRPLVVANPLAGGKSFSHFFNTAAFAQPPQGTPTLISYGNEANGCVRAPGINNWDLTLEKRFPLGKGDTRYFQFRWEAYNAFNHSQFSDIDTTAEFTPAGDQVNGEFGQIVANRPPRVMQFGLKLVF